MQNVFDIEIWKNVDILIIDLLNLQFYKLKEGQDDVRKL